MDDHDARVFTVQFIQQFAGTVGRPIVADHHLQVGERLIQGTLNSLFNKINAVVCRDVDGDLWNFVDSVPFGFPIHGRAFFDELFTGNGATGISIRLVRPSGWFLMQPHSVFHGDEPGTSSIHPIPVFLVFCTPCREGLVKPADGIVQRTMEANVSAAQPSERILGVLCVVGVGIEFVSPILTGRLITFWTPSRIHTLGWKSEHRFDIVQYRLDGQFIGVHVSPSTNKDGFCANVHVLHVGLNQRGFWEHVTIENDDLVVVSFPHT